MANSYYDNSDTGNRFLAGETARGEDVDAKFDAVEAAFDSVSTSLNAKVKTPEPEGMTIPTAATRANKILAFDANGLPQTVFSVDDIEDYKNSAMSAASSASSSATQASDYALLAAGNASSAASSQGAAENAAIFATEEANRATTKADEAESSASAAINAISPSSAIKVLNSAQPILALDVVYLTGSNEVYPIPANPTVGTKFWFRTGGSTNNHFEYSGNVDEKIEGEASNFLLNKANYPGCFCYFGATEGWRLVA